MNTEMSFNVGIIGCGQLGARHAESLLRGVENLQLYIVDHAPQARENLVAVLGIESHELMKRVTFVEAIERLPSSVIMVIVATSSVGRLAILKNVLRNLQPRFVLLEKVLFNDADEYNEAASIVETASIPVYVNCPRRLFVGYSTIRERLSSPFEMTVAGGNWGLACNAIHFVDIFGFLGGGTRLNIASRLSDPIPSKRPGFIEFHGTLSAQDEHGNKLHLLCENSDSSLDISIVCGDSDKIVVNESGDIIEFPKGACAPLGRKYQSQLTSDILSLFLQNEDCGLTKVSESLGLHKQVFDTFLERYNKYQKNENGTICPIT